MNVKSIIKFQFVAWLGTLVNLGSLWLLHGIFDLPLSIAGAIAIELAILHNFTWHYFLTWNDRVHFTLGDFFGRLYKYNILTASIDFLINLGTLYSLNKFFGVHYLLADIIGMSAGPIFKFLVNEFVIFRKSVAHHKPKN
ncbi:MAG: hypothetical protein DRP91_09285 [Candidatus Neomarinimicrobiota bacterium]|nr:GtrA family protein [Candidatus Neomarinimicrobiota bacterium]RKY46231.1 MAG: hypothetical protein DRP91_09285 [Candidatus Neomarinimicrobiota bacterium]